MHVVRVWFRVCLGFSDFSKYYYKLLPQRNITPTHKRVTELCQPSTIVATIVYGFTMCLIGGRSIVLRPIGPTAQ